MTKLIGAFGNFANAPKSISQAIRLIRGYTETRDPSHEQVCHVVSIITFGLH